MKMPRKPEKPKLKQIKYPYTTSLTEYQIILKVEHGENTYCLVNTLEEYTGLAATDISFVQLQALISKAGFNPEEVNLYVEQDPKDDEDYVLYLNHERTITPSILETQRNEYAGKIKIAHEEYLKANTQYELDLNKYEIELAEYQIQEATRTLEKLKGKK